MSRNRLKIKAKNKKLDITNKSLIEAVGEVEKTLNSLVKLWEKRKMTLDDFLEKQKLFDTFLLGIGIRNLKARRLISIKQWKRVLRKFDINLSIDVNKELSEQLKVQNEK